MTKKKSCWRRNKWLFPMEFWLFRGTENSRNSVSNPSTDEKTTRNSVPWNKNRRKLLEFPNEPFSRRETTWNSVPRGTRIEANSWNSLPNPSAEEKTTRNSLPWSKNRSKFSEFLSEPFRGRENDSEQNAAAAVSDSYPIESSCWGRIRIGFYHPG